MENIMKFEVKLVEFKSMTVHLQYISKEDIIVKTLRVHNTSFPINKPETNEIRKDEFCGILDLSIVLDGEYAEGVTFVVKDETHKEQYSVGINFTTKAINIKEMMYGA